MTEAPVGLITFLFTDIEGSTALVQKFPDTYTTILQVHDSIMIDAIERNNGFIFRKVGDAYYASFNKAEEAVIAAVTAQKNLSKKYSDNFTVKVRMGIHSGNAEYKDNEYEGYISLSRVNRIMSSGHGGQILISQDSYNLAADNVTKDISFIDLGERRLKDLIRPVRLYQVSARGLQVEFAPLKTLDARPNNLPVQLNSFIGRELDLKNVIKLINENHLVTLTGTGGVGKTRLAIHAAADLIDTFENGVWFIDLTTFNALLPIIESLLHVLSISEQPGMQPAETLINGIAFKEILLVFDNCEHIIAEISKLIEDILTKCERVKIIATSREPLNCLGEQKYFISPLDVPDSSANISLKHLTQCESVKLFVERARSISLSFKLTDENADPIARICRTLDGIPLAIELAAARINVLSVEKINERLSDMFSLLTVGRRTALPKQQTLRSLIDWSYELLTEREKKLFTGLSIFEKGWTLEAAEFVCPCEALNSRDIIDLLGLLTEKSLITYQSDSERYSMLQTIREYSKEKLDLTDHKVMLQEKHSEYYFNFANEFHNDLLGKSGRQWIRILENDLPNFRVAFYNFIEVKQYSKASILAFLMGRFFEISGYITEGKKWFDDILTHKDELQPVERANCLQWAGIFSWIRGEYSEAETQLLQLLEIRTELNDKSGIGSALGNLALVAGTMESYDLAVHYYEQCIDVYKELKNNAMLADALLNYASTLAAMGKSDESVKVWEDSLELYKELNDIRGMSMALNNLGTQALYKEDYNKSKSLFEESVNLQKSLDDKRGLALTLNNLGTIHGYLGEVKKAESLITESIAMHREIGSKPSLSNSLNNLGFVKFSLKKFKEAYQLQVESFKLRYDLNDRLGMLYSLIGIMQVVSGKYSEEAAALAGFIGKEIKQRDLSLEKEIRNIYDSTIDAIKENLDPEKFDHNYEKGSSLKIKDVEELISNSKFTI